MFLHGEEDRPHAHGTENFAGLSNILAGAKEMSQLQPYNRPTVLGYIEVMGSLWKGIRNRDGSSNSTILRIILNTQPGLL